MKTCQPNSGRYIKKMKTTLITTIILLTIQISFGQNSSTYSYQGPCCDNNGNPLSTAFVTETVYAVNNFKSKTPIEINIKSVKIGLQTVSVDISYKDSIESETKIINVNDSIGIKLVLGKTIENGIKKYVYKLLVYRKDIVNKCWHTISTFNTFYEVYSQTMSLKLFAFGYKDTKDYFEFEEGWMKFD